MRKTIHTAEKDSSAQSYYKSIMDDELAKTMSESSTGVGIKDVVLDQIYPQFRQQRAIQQGQQARQAYNIENSKQGVSNE